ncbi:MAG: ribonuclease PH [Chloroflexia bacterium]|nr:ribonuclease PH [Chloroflexia bacterium]
MSRSDGRLHNELRPIHIVADYTPMAEGSALIEIGNTRVLCTASIEEHSPPWLRASNPGWGWVTAEYAMLPRSTPQRMRRERGMILRGRTHEIQRLIGRCLRASVDLSKLGSRTIILDCDVLRADGGTRTASITGAYVALYRATQWLLGENYIKEWPMQRAVAAVSVGLVGEEILLDLSYHEDANAEVDFNVIMTDQNRFVEVQGTAEGQPFTQSRLNDMLRLARQGMARLFQAQREALDLVQKHSR